MPSLVCEFSKGGARGALKLAARLCCLLFVVVCRAVLSELDELLVNASALKFGLDMHSSMNSVSSGLGISLRSMVMANKDFFGLTLVFLYFSSCSLRWSP